MYSRREFLRNATLGIGGVLLGSLGARTLVETFSNAVTVVPPGKTYRLTMTEAIVEMVDLTPCYSWTFADETGPRFPGPVLFVTEGDSIVLGIQNRLPHNHAFCIPGVVDSGTLRPGQDRLVKFKAPPAGTYMYFDPLNAPLNRVMGLHGVLVSLPQYQYYSPHDKITPFSNNPEYPASQRVTPAIQQLFNDLGTHDAFANEIPDPDNPGQYITVHGQDWICDETTNSSLIWVFFQADPRLNERVRTGEVTTGDEYARQFTPRYFMINGRSGYWSAHAHDTQLHGPTGIPRLIRVVNPGLWCHSPHTHCNHVYELAEDGRILDNVMLLDTWTMHPMGRCDVLFPFIKPPDIPQATWDLIARADWNDPSTHTEEMRILLEHFPGHHAFSWPMHCHQEVSQTAGGGNYPQGMIAHLSITGPRKPNSGTGPGSGHGH